MGRCWWLLFSSNLVFALQLGSVVEIGLEITHYWIAYNRKSVRKIGTRWNDVRRGNNATVVYLD